MALLTVIMPVYNGEKYLEEAIDSILNQSYKNFKLLVLNDNSTDATNSILDSYTRKDDRVKIITKTKNVGPANLRNEGIERSETEFIALMDADDIALPSRFEKQMEILQKHPNIGVCGTWFTIFGDKKEKIIKHSIQHDALKVQFLKSCGIGNPTVMFRKKALANLKFENQFVPAEDYGLWAEALRITEFYNIPESLLRYRWHPNNISQTKEVNLRKAEVAIKKRQLKHFGITENDTILTNYLNAVSLKRNLSLSKIRAAVEASKELKALNKVSHYYNPELFNTHINTTIIRTIRNAKENTPAFYKYVKNESGYFDDIPVLDKIVMRLKSLF